MDEMKPDQPNTPELTDRAEESELATPPGSESDTPRTDSVCVYLKTLNERGPKFAHMAGYSVLGVQDLIKTAKDLERENARLRRARKSDRGNEGSAKSSSERGEERQRQW